MKSAFQVHREKWSTCQLCDLCKTRKRVVLARGTIPCDVLFIGEAPGASEDVVGQPFVGPAGRLLDFVIRSARASVPDCKASWAMTNLVSCIPLGTDGNKTAEPEEAHIRACSDRLNEFVRLCNPKAIVLVGVLAKKHIVGQMQFGQLSIGVNGIPFIRFTDILHPAFILRNDISQQGLLVQRCVVAVADVLSEIGV